MTAVLARPSDNGRVAEWRAGWRVVVAGAIGFGVAQLHFYSLGIMVTPIAAEFGWSRATVSIGPAIVSGLNFLLVAMIGQLVDRIGVRRVAIPGYIAYCLAICALGLTTGAVWTWYVLWVLLGISYAFTGGSLWALAVASRFERSRGLALSIALSGTGLIGALAPTIGAAVMPSLGWRGAYLVLGGSALVIGVPVLLLFLHSAHDLARRQLPHSAGTAVSPSVMPGLSFREALAERSFWIFIACSLIIGTGFGALLIHFVPIAIQRGLDPATAALAAGLIGIAAIAGRLITGLLMDHLPGRLIGGVLFVLPGCVSLILWASSGSLEATFMSAMTLGLAVGAEYDVLAVLVSRYTGMRSYATIYGQIVATFGIGIGIGPPLAGAAFDGFGSYDPLLLALTAAFVVPPLLLTLLGPAPFHTKDR